MKVYLSYRERIAGFFLLASMTFVVLFIVGAAIENQWFIPTNRYIVYISRAEGLRIGSPVLLSGVNVGSVDSLSIMNDSRIEVALSIHEEHASRITTGTRATIQRVMGIGEKRILLANPETTAGTKIVPLQPGTSIPLQEPRDLLEVLSSLDLGRYLDTLDRTMNSVDFILTKLEEDNRMVRMFEAFDNLGPTLNNVNLLIDDVREPFTKLVSDPAVAGTFRGAARVFNEPQLQPMIRNMSKSFDPEKINTMIDRIDRVAVDFERVLAEQAPLNQSFTRFNKLMDDKRIDRLITSLDRLSDEEKIGRLLDNLTELSNQMKQAGPEFPQMAREMVGTLKEMSVVLRAMQRSWPLRRESEKILRDEEERVKEEDDR